MSARRLLEVGRLELRTGLRRPLFWFLIAILGLTAWGLSTGDMRIASGSTEVGGKKAYITSAFAQAQLFAVLGVLYFGFFVAIGAGMIVPRDDEERVGEILHATPLRVGEYVWGKLLGILALFALALLAQAGLHAFFNHALADAESAPYIGPFAAGNYLMPAVVFALPTIVFFAGACYAFGVWSRRPILVFFVPTAAILASVFFLWDFSPHWLSEGWNRLLMFLDPSGVRWLSETWLKDDRGVDHYNTQAIGFDALFVANRLTFAALGLVGVLLAQRRLTSTLRGRVPERARRGAGASAPVAAARTQAVFPAAARARPGFLAGTLAFARVELGELRHQPGLYLFVPLILLQVVGSAFFETGAFDTPILATSGALAARTMNTLTLLLCLLLLFYTVESLQRERGRGLDAIQGATPVRTTSLLFGKVIANAAVAAVILLAAFLGSAIVLAAQGKAPIELRPFALLWGALLVPTFVLWSAFVACVWTAVKNRYATYAIALGALMLTGWLQLKGEMSWAGNWDLWSAVTWSDMGTLELVRTELALNRLLALALAVLFLLLAVRWFPRRASDPAGVLARLRPASLARATLALAPALLPPLVLGLWLQARVDAGFQGDAMEKQAKDYWRKNIATWKDAPIPAITDVVVELELDPARRGFRVDGRYTLLNDRERALDAFPVTPGAHFEDLEWTLDGSAIETEDRAGLHIVRPPVPLARGATCVLGFRHHGTFPPGATANGGGAGEFILPSGVVLTSFSPGFVPVMGYREDVGVDEENRSDPRVWPADHWVGPTDSAFGNNTPHMLSITIRGPAEYTWNSNGVLVSDEVADGVRTSVWKSDHPINFFNVVGGRWDVARGEGTAIYHHPGHAWNVPEMLRALDGARRHFSEWFHPYPWRELKLSEFPGLATYAQGFPTNITFSESIGFLTESKPEAEAAFMVTAHEAAHQWWGNLLEPGKGPGGDLLSEGMAHFSTALLFEEMKGARERIAFLRQIEERYVEGRHADAEQPLVKTDGTRPGDRNVIYDKGGWVFWMLLHEMGRERCLAGLQDFIARFDRSSDHPLLEDFLLVMRGHAGDALGFDAFARQWFHDVVLPEYRVEDASRGHSMAANGFGEEWEARCTLRNVGTGTMTVELAAQRGERFPDEERAGADAVHAAEDAAQRAFAETRATIRLGPGESRQIAIRCGFEPERLVVDPDLLVLQARRKKAEHEF